MKSEIVVITGASAGVGRAAAEAFARRGARIAILARAPGPLAETKADLLRLGSPAVLDISLDVADAGAVGEAAARVERELGPIDIWVNDAMETVLAPIQEITPEEFRRVTEVTYLGTVHGTLAALEHMRPRDRGVIVQVGSALAYRAIPLQSAYCGAKFAVRGFTDSVRCELLRDRPGIHVTMVQLPAVDTPQFNWALNKMPRGMRPMGQVYSPQVAARAIVFAATHRRRELAVGSAAVNAIFANMLVPGLLDRRLARTAVEGQQTGEPADPGRKGNLFAPAHGDSGPRGRFGDRKDFSLNLWLNMNREALLAGAGGVAAAAIGFLAACPDSPLPGGRRRGRRIRSLLGRCCRR